MNFTAPAEIDDLRGELRLLSSEVQRQRHIIAIYEAWQQRAAQTERELRERLKTLETWRKEAAQSPAERARVRWMSASDTCALAGNLSMKQLRERRVRGRIPRYAWRKVNCRRYEYREDVLLSLNLGDLSDAG